jgi:hypothetical protein
MSVTVGQDGAGARDTPRKATLGQAEPVREAVLELTYTAHDMAPFATRFISTFTASPTAMTCATSIRHLPPGVKQQLAAVRMLFDWLITGQVVPANSASAVRGPKHLVKTGKTSALDAADWRKLLDSIPWL